MTTTIATIDSKRLHEIYQDVRLEYPNYSCRFQYFLAGCRLLDPDFDLDLALKLRPHGGLIGIDDSKLDKYLNNNKILRLHAVLHDATGFMYELCSKGPGYVYVLPCPISSAYCGHFTGIAFCIYVKVFKRKLFTSLEC